MKRTKYPVEKIIQILSKANLPRSSVAEVCRKYDIAKSTFEKWKQKFKGFSSEDVKRLTVFVLFILKQAAKSQSPLPQLELDKIVGQDL